MSQMAKIHNLAQLNRNPDADLTRVWLGLYVYIVPMEYSYVPYIMTAAVLHEAGWLVLTRGSDQNSCSLSSFCDH